MLLSHLFYPILASLCPFSKSMSLFLPWKWLHQYHISRFHICEFSSVQSLSHVQLFGLQHTRLPYPSPIPGACSNAWPSSHWCHQTISSSVIPFSSCLQSFPASGSFPNESVLPIRWPKCWSFSLSISPSNGYSGLISFRIDWFDFPAVQETLKSLLQHHSSKVSSLQHSAFFMVQFSHPYMTTGKTIALTRRAFVSEVMSLFFNMLSRLVIVFLTWGKHLLISWLELPSAVILEPPKIKSVSFHCFPTYLPRSDGTRCHDLHFLDAEF